MSTIEINKRSSEEIACWKVEVGELTPNTQIVVQQGVTAVIKINGQTKLLVGGSALANSLMNPGKGAKLFGGNKPYESVEIFAIDQSSEFFAEWGLAGNMAIPCYDAENDVHASAVAFGEYRYKIDNFVNFIGSMTFDKDNTITRSEIREFLRATSAGVIKSYLSAALAEMSVRECQANVGEIATDIKEAINKALDAKGLTVYEFVILKISYDKAHEAVLGVIDGAKLGVKVKKIENDGRLDDVKVDKAASEVEIGLIMANKGAAPAEPKEKEYVFCSRCGHKNELGNYCSKCGEKLNK
jgi:membrane protease subunit (stomatin/prohibitin family)